MNKPILVLDFDGVLHSYSSGWRGAATIPDPPVPGAIAWLVEAVKHFEVHILSSRTHRTGGVDAMKAWLSHWLDQEFGWDKGVYAAQQAKTVRETVQWPLEKPPAFLTIDDRALTFTGNWADFPPETLLTFKPWNK